MSSDEQVERNPVWGWVVGIIVFLICGVSFTIGGNAIGVGSRIELDEPITIYHGSGVASWETETDTLTTWYGQMTTCLSIVLAIWAGFAAWTRRLDAGWDLKSWITFRAWAVCLAVLSILAAGSPLVFPEECGFWLGMLESLHSIGLTIGVGYIGYRWHDNCLRAAKAGQV